MRSRPGPSGSGGSDRLRLGFWARYVPARPMRKRGCQHSVRQASRHKGRGGESLEAKARPSRDLPRAVRDHGRIPCRWLGPRD